MSDASTLNTSLGRAHPAAERMLSPLGRALVFPRGIPFQSAEARGARIDATIGQLTNSDGSALPLPAIERSISGIDPRAAFLYAPVEGPPGLREAWRSRERRLAAPSTGELGVRTTLPLVTHGLTHALSLVASLFADSDTDVLIPSPSWENYELVFGMCSGARPVRFPLLREGRFDVGGLEAALAGVRRKALLVLNFPSNPLGWTPTAAEARQLVEVVKRHRGPMAVVTDDAYQGWVYEPDRLVRSMFWELAEAADPDRLVVVKADAATKALVFFSSRVGFVTFATSPEAEEVLTSKLKCAIRGTVGSASGPALAMVERALADPGLESAITERRALLAERYRTLRAALDAAAIDPARLRVMPFNSAFFMFARTGGGLDPEALRQKLLAEHSVGIVSFPEDSGVRIAYCSIGSDRLPELVDSLARAAG